MSERATAAGDEEGFWTFDPFQQELDACFHARGDPWPAPSAEHAECLQFVTRLHKMRQAQQKRSQDPKAAGSNTAGPADLQLCEQLGLPSTYDARYRVNCAVVGDKERLRSCIRAIDRKLAAQRDKHHHLRHHSSSSRHDRSYSSSRHDRDRGRERDRGRGHDGRHASPEAGESEDDLTGSKVVEAYRACLPWYEDFCQRRQAGRLRKMMSDRAALPMAAYQSAIVEAVRAHQAVVIAGDTGCGKSTQVPQFLVAAGFKRVVCTQPRRISAISLARRVSYETLNVHGDEIAYKIRFASTMTGGTKVLFCTEGILLRMLASDPQLSQFEVVVVDEVHERHLNTDFLLALLRALLYQRPELRVVLMSATINFEAYSQYFGGCPVIQVPGRLYPIQLEYCPPPKPQQDAQGKGGRGREDGPTVVGSTAAGGKGEGAGGGARGKGKGSKGDTEQDNIDPAPYLRLLQRIDSEVPSSQRGDLLIFVAGLADITTLSAALKVYASETRRWIVLPLHSSLSVDDQDKVFDAAPEGVRKAIISTNIAETSVTIDGVRFVADSGRAKEMVYDVASGAGSLQEGWISRASADQRKGRAGRTGPGKCFRMYSAQEYEGFRPFSLPEIQRVRLESVVLQIKALAGDALDPRRFGFIDPPPEDGLEAAIINLKQVGALTASESLTPLGALLSLLPVDPHVGKLLVLGAALHLTDPCLTIAAALSVQSPFARLAEEDEAARSARFELLSPHGDPLTLLGIFEEWVRVKERGGKGASTKWCKRAGLEEQRLHEMAKLKAQFTDLLNDVGLGRMSARDRPADLMTALERAVEEGGDVRSHMGGDGRGGSSKGKRHHMSSRELHAAKRRLRELQAERDRERGRKVLKLDEEGEELEAGSSSGSGEEGGRGTAHGRNRHHKKDDHDSRDGHRDERSSRDGKRGKKAGGGGDERGPEDLRDLELRVAVDLRAMAAAASRPLSKGDIALLKWLLAASLYPRFALPDPSNRQRREQDARFHISAMGDLVVHPSSCLTGNLTALSAQELLVYVELLETRRQYLCNLTPVWSLPALLLTAGAVDCDAPGVTRLVVDGWLLIRIHDGTGPRLLALVCQLRRQVSLLLRRRLAAARLKGLERVTASLSDMTAALAPDVPPGWDAASLLRAGLSSGAPPALLDALGLTGPTSAQHADAGSDGGGGNGGTSMSAADAAATAAASFLHSLFQAQQPGGQPPAEEQPHAGGGGGTSGAGSVMMHEDELAEQLALAMDWPIRYSLERLLPGSRTTALYLTSHLPSIRAGEEGGQQQPQQPPQVDSHGAPRVKAGLRLAPWLWWGSLKGFDDVGAAHALAPALRKHWACPACGTRLIGTHEEIGLHLDVCPPIQALDRQALISQGYQTTGTASKPAAAAATAGGEEVAASGRSAGASDASAAAGTMSAGQPGGGEQPSLETSSLTLMAGDVGTALMRLEDHLRTKVHWGRRIETRGDTGRQHDQSGRHSHSSLNDHRSRRSDYDHDHRRSDHDHDHDRRHGSHDSYRRHDQHRHTDRSTDGDHHHHHHQQQQQQQHHSSQQEHHKPGADGVGVSGRESHRDPAVRHPPASVASVGGATGSTEVRGGQQYTCPVCGLTASMTPAQILLHRRMHASGPAGAGP